MPVKRALQLHIGTHRNKSDKFDTSLTRQFHKTSEGLLRDFLPQEADLYRVYVRVTNSCARAHEAAMSMLMETSCAQKAKGGPCYCSAPLNTGARATA